jgi:hypothetical protein
MQQIYTIIVMLVCKKCIWSINNTAARATHHFSKEAEIKAAFEVVFCVSVFGFTVCLYLVTEI